MEGEGYVGGGPDGGWAVHGLWAKGVWEISMFSTVLLWPYNLYKTKVNLFPKERRRKGRREWRWEVGMEGGEGRGSSTASKGWHGAAAGVLRPSQPPSTLEQALCWIPGCPASSASFPSQRTAPGLRYAPCRPSLWQRLCPALLCRSPVFFAQLYHAGALNPAKAVLPPAAPSNLRLFGGSVNFLSHTPFWLICLSCSKDSFVK